MVDKNKKLQDRSICELNRLLIRATRMIGNGVGEFLFDAEIHKAFVKKTHKNYLPKPPSGEGTNDNLDKYI